MLRVHAFVIYPIEGGKPWVFHAALAYPINMERNTLKNVLRRSVSDTQDNTKTEAYLTRAAGPHVPLNPTAEVSHML